VTPQERIILPKAIRQDAILSPDPRLDSGRRRASIADPWPPSLVSRSIRLQVDSSGMAYPFFKRTFR